MRYKSVQSKINVCVVYQELRSELERNQGAVMSLKETADQLLASGEVPEMSSARDKTHIISNRLRSLLHLTAAYIESLETKLGLKVSGSHFVGATRSVERQ
jgi:hypothetical protein